MNYLLPETAITGLSTCGVSICGVHGYYSNVPEDPTSPGNPVQPGHPSFPAEEIMPLTVIVDNETSYPLRGSLNWEDAAGDNVGSCSFTLVLPYNQKPACHSMVKICISNSLYVVFIGQIKTISEVYKSGNEGTNNVLCEYSINCVGMSHHLVRCKVNVGFKNTYAGDIIKKIFDSYINKAEVSDTITKHSSAVVKGHIVDGYYYDKVSFSGETPLNVFAKLAEDSDCVFYIDSRGSLGGAHGMFCFVPYGRYAAPSSISSAWSYATDWKFPENNYHGLSVNTDGSQVVSKVIIHGKKFVTHETSYQAYDSAFHGIYPIGSDTQKVFYTNHPIYRVKQIKYAITYQRVIDTTYKIEGPTERTKQENSTSMSPSEYPTPASTVPSEGWSSSDHSYTIDYSTVDEEEIPLTGLEASTAKTSRIIDRSFIKEYQKLYIVQDPNEYLNVDSLRRGESVDYLKYTSHYSSHFETSPSPETFGSSQVGSVTQNIITGGKLGTSAYGIKKVPWVVRTEDRKDDYDPNPLEFDGQGAVTENEDTGDPLEGVPALWTIGYDSNTVTFNGELYNTDTFMSRITYVWIEYEEMADEDYSTVNRSKVSQLSAKDGGTGVYELEYTMPEITNSAMAKEYSNIVFKNKSECRVSASYSCYQKGLDIHTKPLRVGMSQRVNTRGHNHTLTIESIRYSLQKGSNIPIFKLDVSLSTHPRNMTRVLTKLLRKHR
jgi:hypothetical protein